MRLISAIIILLGSYAHAQIIPCSTTTITVKGATFSQICNSLLDSGYVIDKKDSDLRTVSTQPRAYPSRFNATYVIGVRVKDSVAYFKTTFNAPSDGSIVRNEPVIYKCKKNGKPIDNIFTYPFRIVDSFVKGLGLAIDYK